MRIERDESAPDSLAAEFQLDLLDRLAPSLRDKIAGCWTPNLLVGMNTIRVPSDICFRWDREVGVKDCVLSRDAVGKLGDRWVEAEEFVHDG